jgi:hypothetical protein
MCENIEQISRISVKYKWTSDFNYRESPESLQPLADIIYDGGGLPLGFPCIMLSSFLLLYAKFFTTYDTITHLATKCNGPGRESFSNRWGKENKLKETLSILSQPFSVFLME